MLFEYLSRISRTLHLKRLAYTRSKRTYGNRFSHSPERKTRAEGKVAWTIGRETYRGRKGWSRDSARVWTIRIRVQVTVAHSEDEVAYGEPRWWTTLSLCWGSNRTTRNWGRNSDSENGGEESDDPRSHREGKGPTKPHSTAAFPDRVPGDSNTRIAGQEAAQRPAHPERAAAHTQTIPHGRGDHIPSSWPHRRLITS